MDTRTKAVITGGAGFIGSHIARALQDAGHDVHVVDTYVGGRFPERVVEGVVYHEVDIRDTDELAAICAGADVLFHTAALPRVQYSIEHPIETTSVNIDGTVSVLTAAQRAGVRRVVYSASSSAYGDQDVLPLVETMTPSPMSPYALQKYFGEEACKVWNIVHGLETVSLRYFNVYGPHADPHGAYALVVAKFIESRKQGESMSIAGDGTHTRDYTHVRDIVRANLLAAAAGTIGNGEVINLGGGRQVSVNEVAELVGGESVHVEPRLEPAHTLADTTKAKELLGWQPSITFEEGVAELKQLANLA